jgi:hypothetical protein
LQAFGPFLDTAVRNYSSGMYVRLGFAIAINVDPDILLVDEVLAVGDQEFQSRSLERMQDFKERGKTMVVVSHDLEAVQELCDRTIVLQHGRIVFDGPAREGVAQYARLAATRGDRHEDDATSGTGKVRIDDVTLVDAQGAPIGSIAPSTPVRMRVRLTALEDLPACSVGMSVDGPDGPLYEMHTAWHGIGVGPLAANQSAVVDIRFMAHLLAGHYPVTPQVTDPLVREQFAVLPDHLTLEVRPAPGGVGTVDLEAAASVTEGPALALGAEPPPGRSRWSTQALPARRGADGCAWLPSSSTSTAPRTCPRASHPCAPRTCRWRPSSSSTTRRPTTPLRCWPTWRP